MLNRLLAVVFGGAVLLLASSAGADEMNETNEAESARRTRACTPQPGLPVKFATSTSSSTSSAQLDKNVVYWMRCTTETFVATAATAPTATAQHFPMPEVLFPLLTTKDVRYVAGLAKDTAGVCYLWSCK